MSIPLDIIRVWSIESAGHFDRDMELRVWFKGFWNNKVKQDLRKGKADLFGIQSFLAHFIIGNADGKAALANAQAYQPSSSGGITKLLGLFDDAHMMDPAELTSKLRSPPALLQQDESVEAAFKCGRDLFVISSKRIIIVDKKGITGKSVEYKSYPLMYNKAFYIETEGHLLNGAEVKVYADDGTIEVATGQASTYDRAQQSTMPVVESQLYQPVTFQVQVPPGVEPGRQLQVQHPNTQQMLVVTVPEGLGPGSVFNVSA